MFKIETVYHNYSVKQMLFFLNGQLLKKQVSTIYAGMSNQQSSPCFFVSQNFYPNAWESIFTGALTDRFVLYADLQFTDHGITVPCSIFKMANKYKNRTNLSDSIDGKFFEESEITILNNNSFFLRDTFCRSDIWQGVKSGTLKIFRSEGGRSPTPIEEGDIVYRIANILVHLFPQARL